MAYRLFISYAHKSEHIKKNLRIHLEALQAAGLVELWDDREIPAGSDWRAAIEAAMDGADAALFIVCPHFLASRFCQDVEAGRLLERQESERVLILYVLAYDCLWEEFAYLRRPQLLPRDAKPLTHHRKPDQAYSAVAREIRDAIKKHQAEFGPRSASFRAGMPESRRQEVKPDPALARLLKKLPGQSTRLFGRAGEFQTLDEWRRHKGVLLWVAGGGFGKSALLRGWIEQREFAPGTAFLGHSFYSQGSHNQAAAARPFLLQALAEWGIDHRPDTPDAELGRRLAEAARARPCLIVLDGMEPLQQFAPGDAKLHGAMRDGGVRALLAELADDPGQALCLATSRLPLPDARLDASPHFRQRDLSALDRPAAVALLEQRGVQAGVQAWACTDSPAAQAQACTPADPLAEMAERLGRHPLALVLAAEFCHSFLADSAAAFLARDWPLQTGDAHAQTVMAWFDAELAAERQTLDRELARLLGLFDRPAPWAALQALCEPPIPGLSETLARADANRLREALARLKQWGLLEADLARPDPELDAHPLVREHFGARLEQEHPPSFRAAHRRLFDWFQTLPAQHRPDTVEELEPLYRALWHGCKAGAYKTAREAVYRDRILRGDLFYTQNQLGAYTQDLAALAGFFPDGWAALPVTGAGAETLSEADRSRLLADVAFCLMSLGRLDDALGPRRLHRQRSQDAEDWNNFCISSNNLIDLLTPLGRWDEALAVADEALAAAARIDDAEWCWQRTMTAHAYRGRVLHGQGRMEEAQAAYAQAEAVQAEACSYEPRLYSLWGFDYAQLLLERACRLEQWQAVLERGRYSSQIVRRPLSQALDHCTLGLALSGLGETEQAEAALDRAVSTMQQAGKVEFQPLMHLARARHRRRRGQWERAFADLNAARRIAEAGGMRAYLADAALLAGALWLETGPTAQAAAEHAQAAEIIHADGYGRRLAELHLLAARLRQRQHDPAAARAALQAAEARLRATGQWALWPELEHAAAELGLEVGPCPGL